MSTDSGAHRTFCILGTAGHIDHGKSALVHALTGTDPDRLPEEQERGMTIVLGFARLTLGAGADAVSLGIVDVPGHERFLRTMVAGATGVDLGMLVVAADDGVMPQTREHVEILDLLGVRTGVVAITKADLVDAERIAAVEQEIGELLGSSRMKDWPILATSARAGTGLDALRQALLDLSRDLPTPPEHALFRLAIDRVFAIHGRGTVVTGSILSGKVSAGTELDLLPIGRGCKVREVQSHGEVVTGAGGGQRAALNLTGLDREVIERGMELATPGFLVRSRYVDARVQIPIRRDKALESYHRVRVCMATSETMATLVVVGGDRIDPGDNALVQLRFWKPVVASFGQRFILRSESSHETVGGGSILCPASTRLRPNLAATRQALERAESEDSFVRVCEAIRRAGFEQPTAERVAGETGIEPCEFKAMLQRMESEGILSEIGSRKVHKQTVEAVRLRVSAYLKRHHANKPTEPGISRDHLIGWIEKRTAHQMGKPIFKWLEAADVLRVDGPYVAHQSFRMAMSAEDAELLKRLLDEITSTGYDPPEWAKLSTIQSVSKQRAKMLADRAKIEPGLVLFAPHRYISSDAMERFKQTVVDLGRGGRRFKLADVRDGLGVSRRVVQPLLEYLDRSRLTKRIGDERVLAEEAS